MGQPILKRVLDFKLAVAYVYTTYIATCICVRTDVVSRAQNTYYELLVVRFYFVRIITYVHTIVEVHTLKCIRSLAFPLPNLFISSYADI